MISEHFLKLDIRFLEQFFKAGSEIAEVSIIGKEFIELLDPPQTAEKLNINWIEEETTINLETSTE